MLTPASSAMRLVLALSKPSLTRMRAVASTRASTVARDLSWAARLRGLVSGRRARLECEWRIRVIAHIIPLREMNINGRTLVMGHRTYAQLIDIKRWADLGLYDVV